MQSAMTVLGFKEEELWFIWRIVAAILHLGNLSIVASQKAASTCCIENAPRTLSLVFYLICVSCKNNR